MIALISKTTPPFCHEWQRVRMSSRHLIGRASISIIIIRSIIVITIIIILILNIRSRWRRWRRSLRSKATYDHLLSCNTTDTNVHLIQLCRECIKVSIHALQLRHDVPEWHIARRRGGSGCGWSRTRWSQMRGKSCWIQLLWLKLHLAMFNGSGVYGTHDRKVVGRGKRNRKMA